MRMAQSLCIISVFFSFFPFYLALKQQILEDIRRELREYHNATVSFGDNNYLQLTNHENVRTSDGKTGVSES